MLSFFAAITAAAVSLNEPAPAVLVVKIVIAQKSDALTSSEGRLRLPVCVFSMACNHDKVPERLNNGSNDFERRLCRSERRKNYFTASSAALHAHTQLAEFL